MNDVILYCIHTYVHLSGHSEGSRVFVRSFGILRRCVVVVVVVVVAVAASQRRRLTLTSPRSTIHDAHHEELTDGPTHGRTDGRTDGRTGGRTDGRTGGRGDKVDLTRW